jgi:hypothetical protein
VTTPFLDNLFRRVDFDRGLVFKFFTVFSLFEYALKNTQYKHGNSRKVEADWESFASDITPHFQIAPESELESAVNYLLSNPPKKQIIDTNNQLTFEAQVVRPSGMSDAVWLSVLIRRVRNNLFHGGKFRYERPRDPELIQCALVILETWGMCHPDVEQALRNIQ